MTYMKIELTTDKTDAVKYIFDAIRSTLLDLHSLNIEIDDGK